MTATFADTGYFLALVSPTDELHPLAKGFTPSVTEPVVTTAWILTEVADALSRPATRALAVDLVRQCSAHPGVEVVPPSQELFDAGMDLFGRRQDKEWSLTDCISFVVMERRGMRDALTADHHFEQAGFNILLT